MRGYYSRVLFVVDIMLVLCSLILFPAVAQQTGQSIYYLVMALFLVGALLRIGKYIRKQRGSVSQTNHDE